MKYIVEFNKSLREKERIAIIRESGSEHLGNIFANYELIKCNDEVAEHLKINSNILSIHVNQYATPQDAESAEFPAQFINVLDNAHEKGYKGDGVVVAVIDSGINHSHEDLQFPIYKCARILDNAVVSVGNLDDIRDDKGHGTTVASVIAMQNNDLGNLGVSPNAKMMVIKATDVNGSMTHASQAKSIVWAVDNGAEVINISYAQPEFNPAVNSACQYAKDKNVAVVASAGNYGIDLNRPSNFTSEQNVSYWKDYPGVIVVGAIKEKENWGGKEIPEFDPVVHRYPYMLIYYREDIRRYRILLSGYPITIEPSQNYDYDFLSKKNCQLLDMKPEDSLDWVVYGRMTDDFRSGADNEMGVMIVYTNHKIIDNINGGVTHTTVMSLDDYKEHFALRFGSILPNYTGLDVIKTARSSVGEGIDFVAPSVSYEVNYNSNEGYSYYFGGGTSFSAPYVAGVIAILRQRFPNITVNSIYKFLRSFVMQVDDGNPNYYGNGLVTLPDLSVDYTQKIYFKDKGVNFDSFVKL